MKSKSRSAKRTLLFSIKTIISCAVAKRVAKAININNDFFKDLFLGDILYWTLRVVIVFPLYQLLLLVIGTLFLQFKFFWNFEKKILCRIGFKRFFKK